MANTPAGVSRPVVPVDTGARRTPSVGVVESDLLAPDRHDRHDRLACVARRRRLGGWRGSRLPRRGVGGQRRQCGHRRERHNGGNPPTPRRHDGLRRHDSIYHAMSRLKCLETAADRPSFICSM